MTPAARIDAFGRSDDGTDGRRSIARALPGRNDCIPRAMRLTDRGRAVLAALRLGAEVDPLTLEYIVVPRWLLHVKHAGGDDAGEACAGAGVLRA